MLLTFLITSAILSIFAAVYYLSKIISCNYFRRVRGWRKLRRSSNDVERFHDEVVVKDWIEMDVTEKGAQSPHLE
jgi:hypothetical protein